MQVRDHLYTLQVSSSPRNVLEKNMVRLSQETHMYIAALFVTAKTWK